jgi:hypothetical protein
MKLPSPLQPATAPKAARQVTACRRRPNETQDEPLLSLHNNTAGVREREDENRTREAGNLDEIQARARVNADCGIELM